MPFFATTPDVQLSAMRGLSIEQPREAIFEMDAGVLESKLDAISVGATKYPLRRPLNAIFIPGQGELVVEGLSPLFFGNGDTEEIAMRDLQEAIHLKFQELIAKRPFEMSDTEAQMWEILTDLIDVTVYRNTTLLRQRAFGRVLEARPTPQRVEWDGGQREAISLDQVDAPDFVTYKPGQPFEAVVLRDPVTFKLARIVHVERKSEPSRMTPSEEAELLEEIGSSKQLEETEWD